MGSSSSKPQGRPYPLLTPGFNVPYGQNPNQFLPPHLQPQSTQKKQSRRSSSRRGSSRDEVAQAFLDGVRAGNAGLAPIHQPTHQPQPVQPQPIARDFRPVVPPAPVAPSATTQRTQTPFTGGSLNGSVSTHQQPQQQQQQQQQQNFAPEPQAQFQQQQTFQPAAQQQQQQQQPRINADIAHILQPLPPANRGVFGPPPPQQPLRQLSNPLPPPPRDLYELSPYNTLLNLPQTTALLTAAYSNTQQPAPASFGRRRGSRTGGLLRALTGRRRKEDEDVHFVPVFINGRPQTPQANNPVAQQSTGGGAQAPVPVVVMNPAVVPPPPVILNQDPHQPHQQRPPSPNMPMPMPATAPEPIRFSGATQRYFAFLNYSPHRIMYQGVEYPSAMHLHEAMKYMPHNPALAERIRQCPSVADVHPLSEELTRNGGPRAVRADWGEVYLSLMRDVILAKFRQHPDLRAMLLETGDAPLIYADEHDTYWGEGPPGTAGLNNLGVILEQVRRELRVEAGLAP
ncbi:hypothetical protein C8J57DRAFT_1287346 [Mycena rebaudengoi]|nr:hypothetical protein C8J57DRAFT_1287346 [Mycena rebaudengoi]